MAHVISCPGLGCKVCVCVFSAVTEELLQAVYIQYQQKHLVLSVRTLLLRFFSQLYIQEHQKQPHIARYTYIFLYIIIIYYYN